MAAVTDATFSNSPPGGMFSSALGNRLLLGVGIAAVIAVMSAFWLWSQQPDYRVLFSNFSDKDGGAIVGALEQMNVPYKFSEGGSAILVPAAQVHQARLRLAAEGLPKGGNVGFEIMEQQKFGVSQFLEQVNFQRALEGELERSVQSIAAVQNARIHLAIPKSSVFVRDQQKPTASVLLNLQPGRTLDAQQVSAVVHLLASSVPELTAANVTVVDQNGNLLSDSGRQDKTNKLDPNQIKYVEALQQSIARRVESIISPIVGAENVRAEASADVDFASVEQAAEIYKPNQTPDSTVIRSQQSSESATVPGNNLNGGVPGALSNQPPAEASAPLVQPTPAEGAAAAATAAANPPPLMNTQKNATTNYEVDKTVRYSQQAMGGVKRLTVAVVVNFKREAGKDGKLQDRPLSDAEKTQIADLARQAMGFNEARGDTLTVVNSSFAGNLPVVEPEVPLWKQPQNIAMGMEVLKLLAGVLVMLMLYLRLLKPMLRKLVTPALPAPATPALADDSENPVLLDASGPATPAITQRGYVQNLETAKSIAKDNPKMVANVVTNWVSNND